jgi:hypothetical protein
MHDPIVGTTQRELENAMQTLNLGQESASRVRMMFKDRVLSFDLMSNATFGDVASTLNDLSLRHYPRAVEIKFTLGSGQASALS